MLYARILISNYQHYIVDHEDKTLSKVFALFEDLNSSDVFFFGLSVICPSIFVCLTTSPFSCILELLKRKTHFQNLCIKIITKEMQLVFLLLCKKNFYFLNQKLQLIWSKSLKFDPYMFALYLTTRHV